MTTVVATILMKFLVKGNKHMSKTNDFILNAIELLIDKKIKNLPYNSTVYGQIMTKGKASNTLYKYNITQANNTYIVTSPLDLEIGQTVKLIAPCGDYNKIYIDGSDYLLEILLDIENELKTI